MLELYQRECKKATIGQIIDDAMVAIEKTTRSSRVLPKDYARLALDKTRLGELIDILPLGRGQREPLSGCARSCHGISAMFASAEGKNGENSTLHSVLSNCW